MKYFSKVYGAQIVGLDAHIVAIETDVTKNTLHAFSIVGLPDKAVEEARDRVGAALKNSGFRTPKRENQKIVVSLAPAELKKEGPTFDMGIALGYLLAVGDNTFETEGKIFAGELSLDGVLRPIRGALLIAQKAKKQGFQELFISEENAVEAALVKGITVYGVKTFSSLVKHLEKKEFLTPQKETEFPEEESEEESIDLGDIRGQESAKRALVLAAAGGHNVAFWGPPGTGKTMLGKCLSHLLPPLSFEEALEVTGIHSAAGHNMTLITKPVFRSPHHTSSYTAIVGGGSIPRPGEITLAHKGVLFLDEFPEFEKRVLESLRQPLEEKMITISRVRGTDKFPAQFILVASLNPCPCGYFGSTVRACTCTASALEKYKRKISGPIMDRIDMWMYVGEIDHKELLEKREREKQTPRARESVMRARHIQKKRLGTGKQNAHMTTRDIESHILLDQETRTLLETSAKTLGLSARAYHKVLKVARTIADLEEKEHIESGHILEALQYRPKEFM